MAYIDLIRPKNLLIVAFTQLFFQYIIIVPVFDFLGIPRSLDGFNLSLLIVCTVLITAGGNVINDYYDREIDIANNRISGAQKLTLPQIFNYYLLILHAGGLLAIYIAYQTANLKLFWIYPLAVGLLFLYSYRLKHLPLIGNVVVSLFTALVIFILLFAEREGVDYIWTIDLAEANILRYCSVGFMSFAFLVNLVRELIKDMEDEEGDRLHGAKTLPITIGIKATKTCCYVLMSLLFIALLYWSSSVIEIRWAVANKLYHGLILILPLFYFLFKIYKSTTKQDYHSISQQLKLYMIAGLLYLPFYYIS